MGIILHFLAVHYHVGERLYRTVQFRILAVDTELELSYLVLLNDRERRMAEQESVLMSFEGGFINRSIVVTRHDMNMSDAQFLKVVDT